MLMNQTKIKGENRNETLSVPKRWRQKNATKIPVEQFVIVSAQAQSMMAKQSQTRVLNAHIFIDKVEQSLHST